MRPQRSCQLPSKQCISSWPSVAKRCRSFSVRGSGAFVARYELEAQGPDGRLPEKVQQQGAGFLLRGLYPGKWTLRVRAAGFAPLDHTVEVPPGSNAKTPSLTGVRVEVSRAAAP